MRLTENGNARSEQLIVMSTGSLTNREWLPEESSWVDWNFEGPYGFKHEISDLFSPCYTLRLEYRTCLHAGVTVAQERSRTGASTTIATPLSDQSSDGGKGLFVHTDEQKYQTFGKML